MCALDRIFYKKNYKKKNQSKLKYRPHLATGGVYKGQGPNSTHADDMPLLGIKIKIIYLREHTLHKLRQVRVRGNVH